MKALLLPTRGRLVAGAPWVCRSCQSHFSTTARLSLSHKRTKNALPDSPARTRFAPSPTGYLHLGSLRTALFNYLLAKRTGGQFLLRIEDTDQKRTILGAEQRLYDDLRWAGIHWDEGPVVGGSYGPYRQSERTELYKTQTKRLISGGHAYRCFCTPEHLDGVARHRNEVGLTPGYDRTCAGISKEESDERAANGELHVVRLRVDDQYPMFNDLVYGKTGQNRPAGQRGGHEGVFPDPILIKSDGHPTYHLANVVDDHFMEITHVIRGTEWMSSTPMHMALYNAFEWTPPQFGHVPLLVDMNGQKLSKRNADIDISFFKDQQGIFPETLANFAALLGWSHTRKSDVFSLKELEETFNLKLTKGNTVVAFEKLWFLQKAHAKRYAAEGGPQFDAITQQVVKAALKRFTPEKLSPILKGRPLEKHVASLLREGARSYTTAEEFIAQNETFFTQTIDRPSYTSAAVAKNPSSEPAIPISTLHTAAAVLTMIPEEHWTAEVHRANIASYIFSDASVSALNRDAAIAKAEQEARKELFHYLRWALSGGAPGIGIPNTMEILGRDETVRRLQDAREATKALLPQKKMPSKKSASTTGEAESKSWMGSLAGLSK
ncbi:glutamyl-tRNA synthetase [Nannizzia gypsea CBS 118893]|uniref:Glutamate--tRNA ligase, mitochondrial n=1 Tax=Arthroderma gypseum (strain ATCC MYA-4604 / CBS 118893) TaxID=535722 RepID=E4V490_ARTGP|nr:glutamyl-tRNA synthetase [Nannizzia gypsea CBS 118893]EFR04814.1 glutamyl-tRNA synthetase [Nannizzia gypsea CBS 118893]